MYPTPNGPLPPNYKPQWLDFSFLLFSFSFFFDWELFAHHIFAFLAIYSSCAASYLFFNLIHGHCFYAILCIYTTSSNEMKLSKRNVFKYSASPPRPQQELQYMKTHYMGIYMYIMLNLAFTAVCINDDTHCRFSMNQEIWQNWCKLAVAWALLPANLTHMLFQSDCGNIIQDIGHETVWFFSQKKDKKRCLLSHQCIYLSKIQTWWSGPLLCMACTSRPWFLFLFQNRRTCT